MAAQDRRIFLLADADLPDDTIATCHDLAASLASAVQEPVRVVAIRAEPFNAAFGHFESAKLAYTLGEAEPVPPSGPMSSAEFVYREDGRPDWSAMWTGFCELALYGGPPHRGDESALHAPVIAAPVDPQAEMIAEIRRGIWETTGLYAEPAEPGWIAVTCDSTKMAAWLCACIILENVDAKCDGEILLLPASPEFRLKNEVKSVITVLAKTNHYWEAHVASQAVAAARV